MPYRIVSAVAPVVQHATMETYAGMPFEHGLWEATMAGVLVGMGYHPSTALLVMDTLEQLGYVPYSGPEPLAMQVAELADILRIHPAWVLQQLTRPSWLAVTPPVNPVQALLPQVWSPLAQQWSPLAQQLSPLAQQWSPLAQPLAPLARLY